MRKRSLFSFRLQGFLLLWGFHVAAPFPAHCAVPAAVSDSTIVAGTASLRSDEANDVNKFLFIISTSNEMEDLPYGGRQALFDLIHTGISDYMRKGDTFGVWTFNSSLYAGEYPMQMWHPSNAVEVATQATLFVDKHDYRSRSDLDEVMAGIRNVMETVRDLNIFIISDYKVRIEGTPFDDALNRIYKDRDKESRRLEKPFITTIMARGGSITTAGVTLAGESIALPTRPPPPPETKVVILEDESENQPARPRSSWENRKPEIIVSKSGTVTKRSESGIIISGPSPGWQPSLAAPALEQLQDDPSLVITPEYEQAIPSPLAVPKAAKDLGSTASPPAAILSQPATNPVIAATTPLPPQPEPALPPPPPVPANPDPAPSEEAPSSPSPTASSPESAAPSDTAANQSGLLSGIAPEPIPVAAREIGDADLSANQLGVAATPLTAMATPVNKGSNTAFWFFAGGAGLLLIFVLGLVYWMAQRRSDNTHTSYITRSMYRK